MTLQASGSISLSDIRGEFGGSTPDTLSEYYRGGGLVPDTATNAGIPTSGSIALSDFYGAANLTAEFDKVSYSASHSVQAPNTAIATLSIANNGIISASPSGIGGNYENQGELTESDFDIRLVTISGTVSSGSAVDTWLNLGTTRSWTVTRSAIGSKSFSGTFEIRPAGGGSTIDTAAVSIEANVDSGS